MVRFSEIIKVKGKKGSKKTPGEIKGREDRFRLSDSQVFKPRDRETVVKEESKTEKKDNNIEVVTYYEIFIEKIQEVKERVMSDMGISPSPILSDLHAVIDKDIIDDLYEYSMTAQDDYERMLVHTVDVTFTSLKVGKGMNYDIKKLLRLGLAAFLENVGMYKIPGNILAAERKLSEDEMKIIKSHPESSYEILMNLGERYKWLAETALSVHERADGSGYPSGIKGDEIPELSSIIGLVDTYIAMIKNRPYSDKFIQTDAIKSIIEASRGKFPDRILKIFLNQISLFPVNSHVTLNNGSVGRVVSTNKDKPLRPTIELLYDGKGNQLTSKQIIRLADNPLLYIDTNVNSNIPTQ
ncbi:HD-GYP domain-containing protein [Thermodesulfobacteriota bacterium]